MELLQASCAQINISFDDADKVHFFGNYVSNPTEFCFSCEEKRLIENLMIQINSEFNSDDIAKMLDNLSLNEKFNDVEVLGWYFKNEENAREYV